MYLNILVGKILEIYIFDNLWSPSTWGLEIQRFAVCIDLFMQRF